MEHSSHALKLDASFRPIEVIDALEAFILCIMGKELTNAQF